MGCRQTPTVVGEKVEEKNQIVAPALMLKAAGAPKQETIQIQPIAKEGAPPIKEIVPPTGGVTIIPLSTQAPTTQPATAPLLETKPLEIPGSTNLLIAQAPLEQIPYQPTMLKGGLAVELIVDTSGSMNGLLGADTKMSIAKTLIGNLATEWATLKDPPIHLALRVFGSENLLEANKCDDSKLLMPLGPINPVELRKNLESIQAKGSSPIAYAMRKAAEDLATQSEDRIIILLTDGKDSCEQEPCAAAKELYDGNYKIITHVVGFDLIQADEPSVKCIAGNSKGIFLLARTKDELASALDEALRSTVPYNLRFKVFVGATPLPTTITVYKAGTQEVIERAQSYGIELFRFKPVAYDISVEYTASIEQSKPSKILKGVELTGQGKVEQEIRFDLASLTLSAHDAKGEPAQTQYELFKAGTQDKIASFTSDGRETSFFLEPGDYDLTAQRLAPEGQEMSLTEPSIKISMEQGFTKNFAFQMGTLVLKGQTSQKQAVPLVYQITKAGQPDAVITKGQVDAKGGNIELSPGTYDVSVEGQDPAAQIQTRGELKNITIEGGATNEQMATLIVGILNMEATKAEKIPAPTEFKITDAADDTKIIATLTAQEGKDSIALPPGKYNIIASLLGGNYAKNPTAEAKEITIEEGKTIDQKIHFDLGTLKLLGRDAKEQQINTIFYIYNGGTMDIVATQGPQKGWAAFDLAPGNYDIRAEDASATVDPKPSVWLRDITVDTNSLYVKEAVFTNAKLRVIGRGANSEIVPVEFKIYEYGHDRAILTGITGQDWQSFDLPAGKYYIEASYHDLEASQILKKWINLKVAENDLVEQELRF